MPVKLDVLEERVANMIDQNGKEHREIKDAVEAINEKLDVVFLTKAEFEPYKRAILFVVSLISVAVIGYAIRVIASHGFM